MNAGDADAALDLLGAGGAVRFDLIDTPAALNARIAAHVAPALQPLFEPAEAAANPGAALARLGGFQVLTALRDGPFGVTGVNAAIERALHRRGLIRGQAANYPGRPLLVGSNDYALGLFNGDLGLLLPDASGALRAWFAGPDGSPRALTPSRLPAHESAYALTVHKSQGSEFGQVLLILPPQPNPLLTRELIYTALTRARDGVTVWGSAATLTAAIGRRLERDSGLADRLRSGTGPGHV